MKKVKLQIAINKSKQINIKNHANYFWKDLININDPDFKIILVISK